MANDTLEGNRVGAIPRQPASHTGLTSAVEGTLADFLASQIASLDTIDASLGGFARTARDLVLAGGKRLRPTFAYWGWRGVAGPGADSEPLLPAFGALELMHTFALVHDDLMDDSDTRRGRPTAHRIFAARHGARFGTSAAVLVGDLCLVWADQLLARTAIPPATLLQVRARYDRMRIEAVAGQYLDVLGETDPASWSVERALLVARHKTASYTVQWPLDFGLALAGIDDAEVAEAYRVYGLAIGEAFQLRDDLLGVYGDPAVTGKPAGDDLLSGKPTALLMMARRMATPAQLSELDHAGIDRKAQIVAETGAPARVEEMIRARVTEGLTALSSAPIDPEARGVLIELATVATQRPA
ncbi:polyprenyl synthetase family protein [Actinoplanes sp. HUAS TT8]|uniref:polyprenyl synthetase family protein n=1 Tax=Actinoplanes sp. HUAS TT8 TaxID=3447453 RepID=UPI003F51B5EC